MRRRRRYYRRSRYRSYAALRLQYRRGVLSLYAAEQQNLARLVYRVLEYRPHADFKRLRGEIWYLMTQLSDPPRPMPTDTQLHRALAVVLAAGYIARDGYYRRARTRGPKAG